MASVFGGLLDALWRFDKWLNGATGGNPDVTLSNRFAEWRNEGRVIGCILCRILHIFDRDHCDKQSSDYESKAD